MQKKNKHLPRCNDVLAVLYSMNCMNVCIFIKYIIYRTECLHIKNLNFMVHVTGQNKNILHDKKPHKTTQKYV